MNITEDKKRSDEINIAFGTGNLTLEQANEKYSEWLKSIDSVEKLVIFQLLFDTFVHIAKLMPQN